MTPLFFILVFIAAFIFWVLISFTFPWIGKIVKGLWDDLKYNINKEEKGNKEDER